MQLKLTVIIKKQLRKNVCGDCEKLEIHTRNGDKQTYDGNTENSKDNTKRMTLCLLAAIAGFRECFDNLIKFTKTKKIIF